MARRLLRALWRHHGGIGRALDAARTEQLALNVVFGEGWLDPVGLGHAWRRTVEAWRDADARFRLLVAPACHFLGECMRRAAAKTIAQRGVDQHDEEGEGADEKDELNIHWLLQVSCRTP